MAVSIRLSDFAPARLVCLATALKQRYHDRKSIDVLIFTSFDAARLYSAVQREYDGKSVKEAQLLSRHWQTSQLHGLYSYDAEKHEEYVDIKPWGSDATLPYDTRVMLPVGTVPHCRLEISGRCLLALDDLVYAGETYTAKASGTVTLAGTITRDGKVTRIQVAEAQSVPSGRTEPFVREAVNNLKTWRLEAVPREDTFRITYSYVIDSSLQRGQVDVQLALPSQVTIRANPPE